jgi:pectin methylesterase-like acyl-CoA thioesterase
MAAMRITRVLLAAVLCGALAASALAAAPDRFPAHRASNVSPDTHLVLTFPVPPRAGTSGRIQVFDVSTGQVVDTLDLAIPAGPAPAAGGADTPITAPSAAELAAQYQKTVIGGFTEGFHFHPVIVRGNAATIYLHNNVLTYGRTYEVQIEKGAIEAEGFAGVARGAWRFQTRARAPSIERGRLVVAADGSGDFTTVQGAVDAIPSDTAKRITVFIKSGRYEEIVYFRHKRDITFLGESRDRTIVGYANNERFNGGPPGVRTHEVASSFPYRRAAFMADRSTGIHLENFTLENFTPFGGSQAEALILSGGRNSVRRVTLRSHQDTVQFNDSVYVEDCDIQGDVDFIWGRGPAFFRNTVLRQLSRGPYMWIRSTDASHGFVFDRCRFETALGATSPLLGRNTENYPASEVVLLDSVLGDIDPVAWQLPANADRMRYLEFRSTRVADGKPADVSQRHPASRQLDAERDAEMIAKYRNPAWVLGWEPAR